MTQGEVCEIFSSIQGEGRFAGYPQIFIRFSGCNLRCQFCDTPQAFDRRLAKKISPDGLVKEIERFFSRPHQALSLTGGEPLMQTDFIVQFLAALKEKNLVPLPALLETNGTLPQELEKIVPYVDFVSMDIKLSSSTGLDDLLEVHRDFLKIALKKNPFVKIIIVEETDEEEFKRAVDMMARLDPHIPLFIQPVTPYGRIKAQPSGKKLKRLLQSATEKLSEARMMPQIHKIIGME